MRVLLDTDLAMGAEGSDIDDGFALALAVAEPGIDLELVTTVSGNTDVESAGMLSLELLRRLGREDVPVVGGAAAPLLRPDRVRHAPDALRGELGHSCAMHDPLAVAVVTRPELVAWRPAHVDVVTGPSIARGACVTDLLDSADAPEPNCRIAVAVDAAAFTEHFLAAIAEL